MVSSAQKPSINPGPSPQLLAFARRQVRDAPYRGPERRTETRSLVVLPVVVQPVNQHLQAIGPPLDMVIQDISPSGCRLLSEQRLTCETVALRFTVADEEVGLVGNVQWRMPCGPFYTCGCLVTAKLVDWPSLRDAARTFLDDAAGPVDQSLRDTTDELAVAPRTSSRG